MRSDLESNRARELNVISGKLGTRKQKAFGDITLNKLLPNSCIDPNGADRDVFLPPYEAGLFFLITNVGTANVLNVKAPGGTLIETLSPDEGQWFYSDGFKWFRTGVDPGSAIGVFGPAGPSHSTGLVPDPGPVAGLDRALFDDGTWKTITASGAVDAYKFFSDGTNTATAQGLTQFKFRSSSNELTFTVTENDATHGDNVNILVNESAIPISGLSGYDANKFVDHTTIDITAGSGLSGGGNIASDLTINLDLNDLVTDTPVLADLFAFYDVSGADTNKATLSTLNGILVHSSLSGYVANEHINHANVSIIAGTGLSGGGDLTASRTLSLAIGGAGGLTTDIPTTGDFIPFYDTTGADHNKVGVSGTGDVLLQTSPRVSTDISPLTNGSASLGINGLGFSNGYFAANAFLDFNSNAMRITHSTGFLTVSGGDLRVPDEAYDASAWDGNLEVPTKNAVRDKIESLSLPATQAFGTIVVSGQSNVVADAAPDTLTLVAGSNITLTTNATTDTITIAASGGGVTDGDKTDITVSGSGATWTIDNDVVTYAKMQNISATSRFIGRITAGAGDPEELTGTQATTLLDLFTSTLKGVVPASGGGSTNFLRADGAWAAPPGGGGGLADAYAAMTDGTATATASGSTTFKFRSADNKLSIAVTNNDATHGDNALFTINEANLDAGNFGGGEALTKTDDTNVTLTLGGTPGTALLKATSLTLGWTGRLAFSRFEDIATDRILGRDTAATGDVEELTVGGGIEFTGSGGIQTSAFTGDVTKAAGGTATTIANNAVTTAKIGDNQVTLAKLADIATDRLLGRDTAATGDPEELTVSGGIEFTGSGGVRTSAFTGDVTKSAGGTALTIANDAVTYAKMQNVSATARFLGRISAGAGDVEELTGTQATTLLDLFTSTLKGLVPLSGGGSTNFLRADGTWAAPPGGGGITDVPLDGIFYGRKDQAWANITTLYATDDEYQSNTASKILSTDKVWTAAAPVANVTASSLTPNFNDGFDFLWTLNATTCTLNNPSAGIKPGQKGLIYLIQDGTGGRTIPTANWGTYYKFPGGVKPTLSTAAGAIDVLSYAVKSATEIVCAFAADVK